jgi:hypothetical protein
LRGPRVLFERDAPAVEDPDAEEAAVAARVPTLRELIDASPAVVDHAAGCELCGDRLRSMVSVRTLLAQRPVDGLAPASVRAAAIPSRLRRPTPPPPLEPAPSTRRWVRPMATVAAAILLATIGGVIAAAVRGGGDDDRRQVEALTRVPLASALAVDPATLDGTTPPPVVLSNRSDRAIEWDAAADVPWIQIAPAAGALEPGGRTELRVGVTSAAPKARRGARCASPRPTGRRRSCGCRPPSSVRRRSRRKRPVCDISVTVEDEGEVRAVELHWIAGTSDERVVALSAGDAGFTGRLANSPTATTWWVTASDARGNVARTPDESVAPDTCP